MLNRTTMSKFGVQGRRSDAVVPQALSGDANGLFDAAQSAAAGVARRPRLDHRRVDGHRRRDRAGAARRRARGSRCRRGRPTSSHDGRGATPQPRSCVPLDFTDGAAVAAAWRAAAGAVGRRRPRADRRRHAPGDPRLGADRAGLARAARDQPARRRSTRSPPCCRGCSRRATARSASCHRRRLRGLPKALVYGASKAALINFTETLYLDLQPKGLGVYLINPGFVKTPLTDQNEFTMPHLITAEEAAREIVAGLRAGDFEIHFPRAFTRQLKFLRLLPYRLVLCADPEGHGTVVVVAVASRGRSGPARRGIPAPAADHVAVASTPPPAGTLRASPADRSTVCNVAHDRQQRRVGPRGRDRAGDLRRSTPARARRADSPAAASMRNRRRRRLARRVHERQQHHRRERLVGEVVGDADASRPAARRARPAAPGDRTPPARLRAPAWTSPPRICGKAARRYAIRSSSNVPAAPGRSDKGAARRRARRTAGPARLAPASPEPRFQESRCAPARSSSAVRAARVVATSRSRIWQ